MVDSSSSLAFVQQGEGEDGVGVGGKTERITERLTKDSAEEEGIEAKLLNSINCLQKERFCSCEI
jgi:hypothetical protein